MKIRYVARCECGGTFSATEMDLSQEAGDMVIIDLDMMGGMVLECSDCDVRVFLPSVAGFIVDVDA